jgi:endonuclease IV
VSPCWPDDRTQIASKLSLLKECVGNKYPTGLEIGLRMEDLLNINRLEIIKTNLDELLPDSAFLSLHAPFHIKKDNFFQSEKGFEILLKAARFTCEIKAELVNIHPSLFISYEELKEAHEDDILDELKEALIQKLKAFF